MVQAQSPLFVPDTISGSTIDLQFRNGFTSFYEGISTPTLGYNQDVLGPSIILKKGQNITLNVRNETQDQTTLHWHGLHVSPENDGGPHSIIESQNSWNPNFTVLDEEGTYWYHPHLHEHTEEQVTLGAAGVIIVRDDELSQMQLPKTYGIDDIPVIIQTKSFDESKRIQYDTALDDVVLCNATIGAYFDTPAQVVRFRLLNGSTNRIYNLGISNNIVFSVIANDGGYLSIPVDTDRLIIAPGERFEILLNLTNMQGEEISIMGYNSELPNGYYGAPNPSVMPMGGIPDYEFNSLNGEDFNILDLHIKEPTESGLHSIPNSLIEQTGYNESESSEFRELRFSPLQMGPSNMVNGPFGINNEVFDINEINQNVKLGNVEIWQLTNMTAIAHPFHIHDVQFYILSINGSSPPIHLKGRKDVVLVPPMGGSVRFITKFEDHSNTSVPYMYHCHMLSHEDDGMMGQFLVLPNTLNSNEVSTSDTRIYPNPTTNSVIINGVNNASISIYDQNGNLIKVILDVKNDDEIYLPQMPQGTYHFKVRDNGKKEIIRIIKI